jgi:acetylornithine deacetylase
MTVDDRRSEIIDLLREIIRIRSVNPRLEPSAAGESGLVRRLIREAKGLGFEDVATFAKTKSRPNLLARLWRSKREPVLALIGHTDTKPVGADEKWRTDPFAGNIIAGRIYGRGAADMKAGLVSMLMAGAVLKETGAELRGNLLVAMTADEEFDSSYGVSWLLQRRLLKANAGIVCEPSGIHRPFDQLNLAVRGSVHFEIMTRGTQVHSSLSDTPGVVNPSMKLASLLVDMSKGLRLHCKKHPLYPQGPTVSLGTILKGGVAMAVIPGQASATCDIRLPPGMNPSQAKKDLNAFLRRMRSRDSELRVHALYLSEARGAEISYSEQIVKSVLTASRQILGTTPKLGGFPATDDALLILKHRDRSLRFPVIPAFGPGMLSSAHQPNESVAEDDVIKATKIYALAALDYLGRK